MLPFDPLTRMKSSVRIDRKWLCPGIADCMDLTKGFIAMPVAHTQAPVTKSRVFLFHREGPDG